MRSLHHESRRRHALAGLLLSIGLGMPAVSATACGQAPAAHTDQCASAQLAAASAQLAAASAQLAAASAPEPVCSCPQLPQAEPAPAASSSAEPAPKPAPCPDGMAFVEGPYCPLVEQRCLERAKNKAEEDMEAVCLKFEKPSICLSASRVQMRYCIDKHEYPNQPGELPRVLVTWEEAFKLCKQEGKRLCSESEFNFACEGEEMLPYAHGFERAAGGCNLDRPYKDPLDFAPRPFSACERDKACKEAFGRLDGRAPIGERPGCSSPFGVFDLNGNVNELVMLRYKEPPRRAALKGGWWGPVRGRCRPIVSHHDEKYLGYEVGFRCCSKPLDEEAKAPKKKRDRTAKRPK
jgi:hypothetical protein